MVEVGGIRYFTATDATGGRSYGGRTGARPAPGTGDGHQRGSDGVEPDGHSHGAFIAYLPWGGDPPR